MAGQTINLSKFVPKFIANLFGAGNSIFNNSYMLGQRGPIWVPVTEPYHIYNTISEVKAVVDRDAQMFSNMKIYKRDKNSKEPIKDPALDTLLDMPNVTQGQNQWLKNYKAQLNTYGNQFLYKNKTKSGQYPISLWNISPFYLQPVLSGKLFDQVSMDGIISKYHMINALVLGDRNYSKDFETSEILFTKINDLNNPLIGKSPLGSLQYPISNIESAYKASNVAMQHVGVGIVSPRAIKDMAGAMPLNPKQREDMEKQFGNDYGISEGQRKTILSNASIDFQSMAVETRNLMLTEEKTASLIAICNIYHMNPQIFLTNTTYENLRSGIVQTFQDNVIPSAEEFMQSLTPFLGLKPNEELCASFEHLSILKENKLKGMQSIESIVKSLSGALLAGIIDKATATNVLANELNLNSASY